VDSEGTSLLCGRDLSSALLSGDIRLPRKDISSSDNSPGLIGMDDLAGGGGGGGGGGATRPKDKLSIKCTVIDVENEYLAAEKMALLGRDVPLPYLRERFCFLAEVGVGQRVLKHKSIPAPWPNVGS
jgi:hypothetical protein